MLHTWMWSLATRCSPVAMSRSPSLVPAPSSFDTKSKGLDHEKLSESCGLDFGPHHGYPSSRGHDVKCGSRHCQCRPKTHENTGATHTHLGPACRLLCRLLGC